MGAIPLHEQRSCRRDDGSRAIAIDYKYDVTLRCTLPFGKSQARALRTTKRRKALLSSYRSPLEARKTR